MSSTVQLVDVQHVIVRGLSCSKNHASGRLSKHFKKCISQPLPHARLHNTQDASNIEIGRVN